MEEIIKCEALMEILERISQEIKYGEIVIKIADKRVTYIEVKHKRKITK